MSHTPVIRSSRLAAAAAACVLIVAAAVPARADDCDYEAQREATIDAAGASLIEIEAHAGSLVVEGREGLGQVEAHGKACSSRESLLDEVRIVTRRSGDRVRIIAEIPESRFFDQARLDLEVAVPADVPLRIDDGSGEMRVRGVATTEIDDGSGDIDVEGVAGDLAIDDGSGEIRVREVAGEVRIEDGSGEIVVRRAGSVTIDEDGSGSIDIADVDGDVTVREDGSGSIDVADVGGDFTVRDDGSGGIRHRGVAGRVSLPRDD